VAVQEPISKVCRVCGRVGNDEEADEFTKRGNLCLACKRVKSKAWYAANRERERQKTQARRAVDPHRHTRERYGLTEFQFMGMWLRQEGRCAICKKVFENRKECHIDHDHACCPVNSCGACVRGLLCRTCNLGLWYVESNPDFASAAVAYLAKSKYTA